MGHVYLYLDETGDFDMSGKAAASSYFGLGQATFRGDHGRQVWEGMQLRFALESEGVRLPSGLHAKNDHHKTRERVFQLIHKHAPRVDVTLLLKERAYAGVKRKIEDNDTYLYRLAWFLHFHYQAKYVLNRSDKVYVVAATLGTGKKKKAVREALEEVCAQFSWLDLTLCTWDSASSWGLQVADYALWTVQRRLVKGECAHYKTVYPLLKTCFRPWEGYKERPAISAKPEKRAPGSLVADRPATSFPVETPPVKADEPEGTSLNTPRFSWEDSFDPWMNEDEPEEQEDVWSAAPPEAFEDLTTDEDPAPQSVRRRLEELDYL